MRSVLVSFGALLASLAILSLGNGLQGTLLGVRANLEGFAAAEIGAIASAYFVFFTLGCLAAVPLVKRVGHIRAFAVLATTVSSAALAHALIVQPQAWLLFRGIAGFCLAGLYVVIESWFNELCTNDVRGRVLSIYRMVDLSAVTAGQFLLTAADPAGFPLFCLVSIAIALSLVPVGLTTAVQPGPVQSGRVRLLRFCRASPLGLGACALLGAGLGSFWGFGPVVAAQSGLDTTGIALFMSATVVGGAVFQMPIGRLSDRFDRRTVLTFTALAAVAASVAVFTTLSIGGPALFIVLALFGGTTMPIYSLAVAHLNDRLEPSEFVEAGAAILVAYGIGAGIGPFAAAALIDRFGSPFLFLWVATTSSGIALIAVIRMGQRAAPPAEDQSAFVDIPMDATLQSFALDPRSDVDLEANAETTPPDDGPPEPRPEETGQISP